MKCMHPNDYHECEPELCNPLLTCPPRDFQRAYEFVTENHPEDLEEAYELLKIGEEDISKKYFFRQYIHVVYCSGFRWETVKSKWPEIEKAYFGFDYAMVDWRPHIAEEEARAIINHSGKIKAILETAHWLRGSFEGSFNDFIRRGRSDLDAFTELPYIGDVTKYHLGMCLGLDVAKPDVHVKRFADHHEQGDPLKMVQTLAKMTELPVRVVDAVIWRASERGFLKL